MQPARRAAGNGWQARRGALLLLAAALGLPFSGIVSAPPARAAKAPAFHLKKPPKGTPVDVLAKTIIYDRGKDVATALGRVQITWGPYLLLARKVVYNRRTDRFQAEGEVYLREPEGNVLLADIVNIDKKFRDGFARHLRLLMTNGATLKARYAVRREGNITIYEDVSYTACQTCRLKSGAPLWEIRSRQATHNQREGRIYHRDVTLRFFDTPVFWLPWISHPDPQHPRSTGFLIPRAGYTKARGFSVTTPYFINLAPNYDITLLPQLNSRQGLLARAKWRHNVGPGTYEVDAGAIRQLQRRKMPERERQRLRWFIKGKGEFAINRHWNWGFQGLAQSDRAMTQRYQVSGASIDYSHLWLQGLDGRNYLRAEAGKYYGLSSSDHHPRDPALLPWMEYEYTFQPALVGGVVNMSASLYSLWRKRRELPFATAPLARRNTRLATGLSWRREWIAPAGVVFQPFLDLRGELRVVRDLPDIGTPGGVIDKKTIARFHPRAGVDVRWPFMASFDGGYQIVSPIAQLIAGAGEKKRRWAGNEDSVTPRFTASHLFLHDRFPGNDRVEGGVRLNMGLLWSAYLDNGASMRFWAGQTLHLAGRNSFAGSSTGLGAKRSDFVAGLALLPGDNLLLSWRGRFDRHSLKPRDQEVELDLKTQRFEISLKYARIPGYAEYGHADPDKQISGKATYRFLDNWRIFGGLNYSLQQEEAWQARRYVGIGYDCDCFSASLTYSEGVSSDGVKDTFGRSISLGVSLKTLGGSVVNSAGR